MCLHIDMQHAYLGVTIPMNLFLVNVLLYLHETNIYKQYILL